MKVRSATAIALGLLGSLMAWGEFSHDPITEGAALPRMLGMLLLTAGMGLIQLEGHMTVPHAGRFRLFALSGAAYLSFPLILNGVPMLRMPALGLIAAAYIFAWFEAGAVGGWSFARARVLAVLAVVCYLLSALLSGWSIKIWPTFIV